MNTNIAELIVEAGFSTTYEVERLTKLCQLCALVCMDHVVNSDGSALDAVSRISTTFELDIIDEQSE